MLSSIYMTKISLQNNLEIISPEIKNINLSSLFFKIKIFIFLDYFLKCYMSFT